MNKLNRGEAPVFQGKTERERDVTIFSILMKGEFCNGDHSKLTEISSNIECPFSLIMFANSFNETLGKYKLLKQLILNEHLLFKVFGVFDEIILDR